MRKRAQLSLALSTQDLLAPVLVLLALAPPAFAQSGGPFLVSFGSTTDVPLLGIVEDEDLVARDPACGVFALYFDGSDVGLADADVDAVHLRADGSLLLSFADPTTIAGLSGGPNGELVDDSDLVLFTPSSIGPQTAGSFSFFFDGSDVGLTQMLEDVDGVWEREDGSLVLTTLGSATVPNGPLGSLSFEKQDAVSFVPTSTGATTAGSYALLFDGSDIGLSDQGEGLDGLGRLSSAFDIHFSVEESWSAGFTSGGSEDVAGLLGTLGPATSGVVAVDVDLSALGFDRSEDVDAFSGAEAALLATPLALVDCSLGCIGTGSVACVQNNVFVNQELVFEFTEPLDLATVNPQTFQLASVSTGAAVPGSFTFEDGDPTRLLFRPQLSFDASGQPLFGFQAGESYQLTIPGSSAGPGPYIGSLDCSANETRFDCVLTADLGVQDLVAGPPFVQVLVDVVTSYDPQGQPAGIQSGVPADGAVDVFRDSDITYLFNDVMNLGSLLDPASGSSTQLLVEVDLDGSLLSVNDRVPLPGSFQASIDLDAQTTTLVFDPAGGLPSAGTGPVPRKIVLSFLGQSTDLAGLQLSNDGAQAFTPEVVAFDAVALLEDFAGTAKEDASATSALWGSGVLIAGVTGGAGFLGELVVESGEELLLATQADAGAIEGATNTIQSLDVLPLGAEVTIPGQIPAMQISDGVYPFSRVRIEPGGSLRFQGEELARLYARGELSVDGLLDASGNAPDIDAVLGGHPSDLLAGGAGGRGGPGAGAGGQGGDRYDASGLFSLLNVGAQQNPGAQLDGRLGEGVGGDAQQGGGGTGGAQWPTAFPTDAQPAGWNGMVINNEVQCSTDMTGSPGGGGSFAGIGAVGIANPPVLVTVTPPPIQPPTPGGDNTGVALDATARELDPELGNLRGGSGGGGGGTSIHTTRTSGLPLMCQLPIPPGTLQIASWFDHSGAGGGGGGGGLQANARRLEVNGEVRVLGGTGGRSFGVPNQSSILPNNNSAAPGGGGAGGSFLGQALEMAIADQPGRIDVSGGEGGDQNSAALSLGGRGGHGLVRLESLPGALTIASEFGKITAEGSMYASDSLSVGTVTPKTTGPSAYSGAQSCWLRPDGNFFELGFPADDTSDPLNPVLGWDMDVVLNGGLPLSWRGPNPFLPVSLESLFGSDLMGPNPSPLVVRFQGVHVLGSLDNPCELDLSSDSSEVLPESRTAWVRHPAELDGYWDFLGPPAAFERRINAIRFQVVFDNTGGLFPGVVLGITDLSIATQPD